MRSTTQTEFPAAVAHIRARDTDALDKLERIGRQATNIGRRLERAVRNLDERAVEDALYYLSSLGSSVNSWAEGPLLGRGPEQMSTPKQAIRAERASIAVRIRKHREAIKTLEHDDKALERAQAALNGGSSSAGGKRRARRPAEYYQRKVVAYLRTLHTKGSAGATCVQISRATDSAQSSVHKALGRAVAAGEVRRVGRVYYYLEHHVKPGQGAS